MPRQTRKKQTRKKQTRRQKKQKGGAAPYLPRYIAPLVEEGKTQEQVIDNFFALNHIYYVSAHGHLLSKRKFEVPPDTYILHIGVSGKVCGEDTRIHDLLEGEGLSPTKKKEQLWKFLTGQLRSGLFEDILYKPNRFDPEGYNVAIYEPYDLVPDMGLTFQNETLAYIELGVYKFPIRPNLFERANELTEKREEFIANETSKAGVGRNELVSQRDKFAIQFAKANDIEFHRRTDNLLGNRILREKKIKFTESELLALPEFPTAPGIRLFIVFSCRAVADVTPGDVIQTGRRMRRESLNLRSYNPFVRELYNLRTGAKQPRLNFSVYNRLRAQQLELEQRKREENERLNRMLEEALREFNAAPTATTAAARAENRFTAEGNPRAAGASGP